MSLKQFIATTKIFIMEHFDFLATNIKLTKLFLNKPSSLMQLFGVAVKLPSLGRTKFIGLNLKIL